MAFMRECLISHFHVGKGWRFEGGILLPVLYSITYVVGAIMQGDPKFVCIMTAAYTGVYLNDAQLDVSVQEVLKRAKAGGKPDFIRTYVQALGQLR